MNIIANTIVKSKAIMRLIGAKRAYEQCYGEGAPADTCDDLRRVYERMK